MTEKYAGRERRMDVEWHQTKGISVSIILLLLVNITSTVWWAASLTNDVETIKAKPELIERVIRLEATVDVHNRYLSRLPNILDKVEATVNRIDKEQIKRAVMLDNHIAKDTARNKRD